MGSLRGLKGRETISHSQTILPTSDIKSGAEGKKGGGIIRQASKEGGGVTFNARD